MKYDVTICCDGVYHHAIFYNFSDAFLFIGALYETDDLNESFVSIECESLEDAK